MAGARLALAGLLGQLLPCAGLGVALVQRRGDWFWRNPAPAAPVDACLTAREGDRCHKAVKYAVEKGYSRHPQYYPEYKHTGSTHVDMWEMQMVLYKLKKAGCAMPCQLDAREADQELETNTTDVGSSTAEAQEAEMPMTERELEDLSLDDLSKYLERVAPKQADPNDGDNGHAGDPGHPTDGGYGSTDGSKEKPPSSNRGKAVADPPDDGDNGHAGDPGHPTDGGDGSTDGSREKPPSRSRGAAAADIPGGGAGGRAGDLGAGGASTEEGKERLRRQLAALGAERRRAERLVQAQKDDYDQLLAARPPAWSPRAAATESRLEVLSAHRQQAERRMEQLEGRLEELEKASGIDPIEAAKIEAQR